MSRHFKLDTLNLAIRLAFAVGATGLHAAEFYPALPPTLSNLGAAERGSLY